MQNVIFGLISGSILAVAASGFAMVRQTEGFLNIAHGQFLALGAALGYVFVETLGMNIFLATAAVMVCLGVIGVVAARIVFDPVRTRGGLVLLFTSIGLAYVLYALIIAIFGVDVRAYEVSFGANIDVGSVNVTVGELLMIAVVGVTVVLLNVFLTRTALGTWIRAVASNPELARVRGIPVARVSATVWFIACALAGLAGVLLALNSSVTSEIGWYTILLVLAASVMGGLGRIYGVMAAALILGLVMSLSTLIVPAAYATIVAFGALILTLLVRPEGLFAVERRREQVA